MPLFHTLRHRFDTESPRTLLLTVLRTVRAMLRRQPAPTGRPGGAPGFQHPFDLARGTDTSGFIPGADLVPDLAPDLAPGALSRTAPSFYNTAYYAISPSSLREALDRLPGSPATQVFVDIGCGKGRALLVAAERPFAHLLGLELSPALAEIARQNTQSDPRAQVLITDATVASLPAAPLVIFLYHPFLAPVLRRLLAHLERHHRQHPQHTILLLYANPNYPRLLARTAFLEQVWDWSFTLSEEDRAADRHGISTERFTLYRTVQLPQRPPDSP